MNRLAKPGLMWRVVAGSFSRDADKELNQLVTQDAVEAYNLPMGTIFAWVRATASGGPGLVTPVGINTFVDPRRQGGRMNAATRTPLAELVTLGGEEALFYRGSPSTWPWSRARPRTSTVTSRSSAIPSRWACCTWPWPPGTPAGSSSPRSRERRPPDRSTRGRS